ncbi:MAG: hypothetical protein Rubg2KO_02730 [Rubricoccaceae bacterium]
MRCVLLALLGGVTIASSSAQPVQAVTDAGDAVVLFSDGIWAHDDGSVNLPAYRDGQRHASEWFRYAVWHPDGWTTMNAVEAYYDGEIAFVPGGDRDSVVVTMEYIPMESTPMPEGEARQRVVDRYQELFGRRLPVRERSVAGRRVSTLDLTELDPSTQSLVSAVTAPGGVVLISVHVEGTGAPIEAIASRFLMGLEIEAVEDPNAFLRDPCSVYTPLANDYALKVPDGWTGETDASAADIELVEADPLPDRTPARARVFTSSTDAFEGLALNELAEAMLADRIEVGEPEADWHIYASDPWPPGAPTQRATRTYASPDGEVVMDVAVVQSQTHAALVVLSVTDSSAMRYGLSSLVNGVRACR